ncbi:hypothetical protein AVEN_246466-1 [Araneus ventricosus]|uniref:Uncharacterized protein n=1 Tax=Araneus ventricosus TaxID=182803 RepID=A0A4Y2EN11_ARAVE|nr:hypothetical protein AVEN_246466-1 [Araneus ventricosus]
MKDQRLESKMVIGGVEVIATKKKRKGKKKTDRRQKKKRKMVKTDADAALAQSMEILEINTMSSSLYTDVITNWVRWSKCYYWSQGRYYSLDGTGLNRSLQWCSCLLQTNELPLRHLLNSLDGVTTSTGPKQFCRPIGKAIKTCEEQPVAPFSSISVDNMSDNIDRMVLSNDQQYLYDICLAISRGEYYSDMALRKPGPVAHSRWITVAGRILRSYVVIEKPTDNLIIPTTYIMKVYATCVVPCQDKALHNRRSAAYLETYLTF